MRRNKTSKIRGEKSGEKEEGKYFVRRCRVKKVKYFVCAKKKFGRDKEIKKILISLSSLISSAFEDNKKFFWCKAKNLIRKFATKF